MPRLLAAIAVCGVLLGAAACEGGGRGHGAYSPGKSTVGAGAAAGQPQAASLVLPAGRSSARYRITAPSPVRYAFDVAVAAPASADVGVTIRTWYGAILSILRSTRDPEVCRRRGSEETCFERFPFLPAQRAGTWTVVASKRSQPAVTVRIAVTFTKA